MYSQHNFPSDAAHAAPKRKVDKGYSGRLQGLDQEPVRVRTFDTSVVDNGEQTVYGNQPQNYQQQYSNSYGSEDYDEPTNDYYGKNNGSNVNLYGNGDLQYSDVNNTQRLSQFPSAENADSTHSNGSNSSNGLTYESQDNSSRPSYTVKQHSLDESSTKTDEFSTSKQFTSERKLNKQSSFMSKALNMFQIFPDRRSSPHRLTSKPRHWSPEEDEMLREAVRVHGEKKWKLIAEQVPGRNHTQCLQRWSKVLAPGLKKGQWSREEDELLVYLAQEEIKRVRNLDVPDSASTGSQKVKLNWGKVAKQIPGRTAKQCRERWVNNLDPDITRTAWSPEEDMLLLQLQELYPKKWAMISKYLPGRTENAVKIRFKSLTRSVKTAEEKAKYSANLKAYAAKHSLEDQMENVKLQYAKQKDTAESQRQRMAPPIIPEVKKESFFQKFTSINPLPTLRPKFYGKQRSYDEYATIKKEEPILDQNDPSNTFQTNGRRFSLTRHFSSLSTFDLNDFNASTSSLPLRENLMKSGSDRSVFSSSALMFPTPPDPLQSLDGNLDSSSAIYDVNTLQAMNVLNNPREKFVKTDSDRSTLSQELAECYRILSTPNS